MNEIFNNWHNAGFEVVTVNRADDDTAISTYMTTHGALYLTARIAYAAWNPYSVGYRGVWYIIDD